jgi:hypothetical protein
LERARDCAGASGGISLPTLAIALGVYLCVRADIWQIEWLRSLCNQSASWLFPGQSAAQQQKAFGAIFILTGLIHLQWCGPRFRRHPHNH